jgi:hypothetical protein
MITCAAWSIGDDVCVNTPSHTVSKIKTPGGRIGTVVPLVLRDTRRSRVEVLPWYIPRSAGVETKLKLTREDRGADAGTAEITLNSDEVEQLHEFLHQFLSVATETDDQYLVIPLTGSPILDVTDTAGKLVSVLRQPGVAGRLAAMDITVGVAAALHGAVRITELRAAVDELRGYLDEGKTLEGVYQDWCERHSWAFGNAYVARDDVRAIGRADTVDLLMKSTASGLRDVIELKRPTMAPLSYDKDHKCWFWSRDVSSAVGQCHRYLDVLHEEARKGLRDHPEIVAYHPRATIVVGRSDTWSEEQQRALHGLNARLHSINVMTYDHLLARAEALLASLTAQTD